MAENRSDEPKVERDPHIYKPQYSRQEVEEVVRWFEERMERLPESLQLNEATSTPDLRRTVGALLNVLRIHKETLSVTFSGYMAHLELIRLRLQEQGME